ncbi:MAG TPA: helix-hairpin-helix domain-containing protein, partial [Ohtaekwangia sp.]|nr:helix-hairpin-helix domain-containing protein [Ohtaekwangia sp.]
MRTFFTLILGSVIAAAAGQNFPRQEFDLQQITDNLYGTPDQELSYEEIHENLLQLLSQPLDINQATTEELRALKWLSEVQLNNLSEYRRSTGNLLSVYELQAVPGFDLNTIYNIIPFVTVHDPLAGIDRSLLRRIQTEGDNYFLVRFERTLQTKKGFKPEAGDAGFTGAPGKLYARFRSSRPGDFSFGFTMEKDEG